LDFTAKLIVKTLRLPPMAADVNPVQPRIGTKPLADASIAPSII
jgi:hypothetical protein